MQESNKQARDLFRHALTFLGFFLILSGTLLFSMSLGSESVQQCPVRNLSRELHELPNFQFEVRIQCEYLSKGRWCKIEKVQPVGSYSSAKSYAEDEMDSLKFFQDEPEGFWLTRADKQQGTLSRVEVAWTMVMFGFLSIALSRVRLQYAAATYFFFLSFFLATAAGWLLAAEVGVWQQTQNWQPTEATVEYYRHSFQDTNLRYNYQFEGRTYLNGWLSADHKSESRLAPLTLAWAVNFGNGQTTCYVNPENPEQACLTRFDFTRLIVGLTLAALALGLFRMVARILFPARMIETPDQILRKTERLCNELAWVLSLIMLSALPGLATSLAFGAESFVGLFLTLAPFYAGIFLVVLLSRLGRRVAARRRSLYTAG